MVKRLLTPAEEATNERLKPLCEKWGAHVFIKVRLADVFPIENSGISASSYRFALQSHFDCIVADDNLKPLFAVEFDGDTHQTDIQRRRDQEKNEICKRFEFPLLRINSRYLIRKYRKIDLLGWFIHTWFATRLLTKAQEEGHIPLEEPIDATFLFRVPGESGTFPLWLSRDIQDKVRALSDSGRCFDPGVSCIVGQDQTENYHAFAYARVTRDCAISARTGMRNQLFPVETSSVLEDIAVHEAYDHLVAVLDGREKPIACSKLDQELQAFQQKYTLCCAISITR